MSEKKLSESCRFCINWVNGSECEIGMPQEICPSRKELAALERDAELWRFLHVDAEEPRECQMCRNAHDAVLRKLDSAEKLNIKLALQKGSQVDELRELKEIKQFMGELGYKIFFEALKKSQAEEEAEKK